MSVGLGKIGEEVGQDGVEAGDHVERELAGVIGASSASAIVNAVLEGRQLAFAAVSLHVGERTVARASAVFAVLIAMVFLKEAISRTKLLAVAMALSRASSNRRRSMCLVTWRPSSVMIR